MGTRGGLYWIQEKAFERKIGGQKLTNHEFEKGGGGSKGNQAVVTVDCETASKNKTRKRGENSTVDKASGPEQKNRGCREGVSLRRRNPRSRGDPPQKKANGKGEQTAGYLFQSHR